MSAGYYKSDLRIRLESPFLSAGLEAKAFGVDAAQLRDRSGYPVLPAGLLRGVLRHALEDLLARNIDVKDVLDLFGRELPHKEPEDDKRNEGVEEKERPGRIRISDARACQPSSGKERATRIAIEPETGAVKEGALLVVELSYPVGKEVDFKAEVRFPAASQAEAKQIAVTLDKALKQVVAVGAYKTVGFGRVVECAVLAPQQEKPFAAKPEPKKGSSFVYSFQLDGPLLVDTHYAEQNVLQSSTRISGAVLKGALARRLADSGAANEEGFVTGLLGEALKKTIISFADVFQGALPLSIVQRYLDKDTAVPDDATGYIADDLWKASSGKAAAFRSDWKDEDWKKGAAPSEADPLSELETRTRLSIEPTTGAAKPSALFSHQFLRTPLKGEAAPIWKALIKWPEPGEPPDEFYKLLGHLKAGLWSIGRLKAGTCCERLELEEGVPQAANQAELTGKIALILTTPHLMVRVGALDDEETFGAAIDDYFKTASDGAWQIARGADGERQLFAQQELRGDLQAARFRPFGRDRLEPFVLMKAGSVFVLEPVQANAADMLSEWERYGLPDPQWEGVRLEAATCPFLRGNGYGAIRIGAPGTLVGAEEVAR
ncbi:RAMP superfamily CRISPR-associated protein [Afifella aestuarii]|uniref:RAMP superfamily CRISPR-associated protein n=1 Tax=Afifella aestuarii TaxID=1909496 RepID=UPI000FE3379D|nr:RAMP superfamily CRISPR-associated protein [Afifella aestuarii]